MGGLRVSRFVGVYGWGFANAPLSYWNLTCFLECFRQLACCFFVNVVQKLKDGSVWISKRVYTDICIYVCVYIYIHRYTYVHTYI